MAFSFFKRRKMFLALLFCKMLLFVPLAANAQDAGFDYFDDDYFFFFEDYEGITIVGTVQTTQQMAVIDREDIERAAASDLAMLLQETLNVGIVRYGGYGNRAGVNLRGFDSRRVAVLINGVPADSVMDGRFDIHQISLDSVERVEVIFGGSDARFNVSGALGGVINIITVRRQEPGWRVGATLSNTSALPGLYRDRQHQVQGPRWQDLLDAQNVSLSLAYGGESAGGVGHSFSANFFANRAANHFIFRDFLDIPRRKDNNEVWDAGANASMVWELPGLTRFIASTSFYHADRNFPTSGFSMFYGNQIDFISRQSMMIEAPRAFHDSLAAEASLTWNFARMDFTAHDEVFSRHNQNSLMAINRWSWYYGSRLTLRSGLSYNFITLDSTEIGNRSRHDGSVSLLAEYSPWGWFMVIPSVQTVFASTVATDAAFIPRLGFLFHVTDSLTLTNNYFRTFKFPDFQDLYWVGGGGIGNPDLRSEEGWGGDLGALWRRGFWELESVVFAQWQNDSIHWFHLGGGVWQPENVGQAMFMGLDNRISFTMPLTGGRPFTMVSVSVSYQHLRTHLMSFGYTFASNQRIPYSPMHRAGGLLTLFWRTGSVSISGHFEGERYDNRENTVSLDPYFLLGLTVNQQLTENLTGFVSFRNLLNQSYETMLDQPMPGLTMTLGMRVRF
ncbi:MAG: TonB-dependent receptor [Spirochaetes bacterium]|nr:TonB-dependent receptor [Spirochaetota bacterium]